MKRTLNRIARDERGIALPLALIMLVTVLLLAGVALATATRSLDTQRHDLGRRKAAAAALAGMRMEVYRMNKLKLDLGVALQYPATPIASVTQCVVNVGTTGVSVAKLATLGGSWCPSNTTSLGDGATYSTQTSPIIDLRGLSSAISLNPPLLGVVSDQLLPNLLKIQRNIVATGSAFGIKRRFMETVQLDLRIAVSTQTILLLTQLTKLKVTGTLYQVVPGSLRECTPLPTDASDPKSGC